MIGTIVNTCTIVAGTLIGVALHKGIKDKYKNVLYDALGLACFAIGLNAVVTNLPKSQYPVLFIAAMAIGSVVGVALDIDGRFHPQEQAGWGRPLGYTSGRRPGDCHAGLLHRPVVDAGARHQRAGGRQYLPVYQCDARPGHGDHLWLDLWRRDAAGSTGTVLVAGGVLLRCAHVEHSRERGADGRAAHRGRPDDHGLGAVAAAHQGLPCVEHAARAAGAAVVVSGHVADSLMEYRESDFHQVRRHRLCRDAKSCVSTFLMDELKRFRPVLRRYIVNIYIVIRLF